MIDWSRILIRTDRPDTLEMLGYWEWLIGRDMHPLVMTKFGDWFLADPQGRSTISIFSKVPASGSPARLPSSSS